MKGLTDTDVEDYAVGACSCYMYVGNVYTYTHTYIYIHIHVYVHTHTHTTQTHKFIYIYIHMSPLVAWYFVMSLMSSLVMQPTCADKDGGGWFRGSCFRFFGLA